MRLFKIWMRLFLNLNGTFFNLNVTFLNLIVTFFNYNMTFFILIIFLNLKVKWCRSRWVSKASKKKNSLEEFPKKNFEIVLSTIFFYRIFFFIFLKSSETYPKKMSSKSVRNWIFRRIFLSKKYQKLKILLNEKM